MAISLSRIGRNGLCLILAAASLLIPEHVVAQDDAPSSPGAPQMTETSAPSVEMAPLIIDGRMLFRLRGISSYPANKRVEAVASRVRQVARDRSIKPSDVRLLEKPDRVDIVAGEMHVISVVDIDADAEHMRNRQLLAEVMRQRIIEAIERFRHERTAKYLMPQGIHGGIALLLLAVAILAIRWLFRWFDRVIERHLERRLTKLEATSFRLLSAEDLKSVWRGGLHSFHLLLVIVLVFGFVDYVLALFPWTRWVARTITTMLIDPLKTLWIGLVNALPGLIFIVILFFVTRYLLRLMQIFFSGIAYGTIRPVGFEREWAWPSYRLLRAVVIIFALVIAYPYVPGSESAAFKGISIFVGLMMSLGATSIVANSIAGYMLIYRRAFRVGDRIKVGDVVGDVVEMRQQLTHLRTPKNEEVTIPSSVILNSNVVNYSSRASQGGLILHTSVGIGYETPWRQVEAMLIEAANRTEGLLREPPPFVLQTGLGDFCVSYEINVYCDRPQQMPLLYTALHRNILDVFNEHGVQIMTPNYVADTAQPKVVPKDQWYAPPAQPPAK
ncbi:MAG: mechanosensitive ion channel [Burkholderiales bacterium]